MKESSDQTTTTPLEPRDMEWLGKGVLGIEWSDGHKGVYPIRYLRQQCPCAACVDEWTGTRRLKEDDVPLLIMLQDILPVGRYALQFRWSDGHDAGIYSYQLLRKLCQCDICVPVKPADSPSGRKPKRLM
ncbi:MAG: DUF971 domain-containing protein [Nitrospira sp.]|nr:DUF971 domain-containing protein [Nitrospira sp.]